jgi:hypothetical protein
MRSCSVDGLDAQGRLRAARQQFTAPLAIGGQGWVGVRLVREGGAGDRQLRVQAVLAPVAARHRQVDVGERGREPVAFARVDAGVVELEQARHEVLARRVLFEPAHQIADGGVELVGVHHRRVEQQPACRGSHRGRLR